METIHQLWSEYLIHVVDILIVAYILYRLFLLIKETRAVYILSGIVILAILTVITHHVLHLKTLSWLLEKFWLAGIIILVVIFQPEIRSALAQLGMQPLGHFFFTSEVEFIDEIVSAVKELSFRKIGSLIAIEQETGLRDFVERGIVINGQVSKELLLSIFNPQGALHDGAVIIHGERVLSASCILPLSDNPAIAKLLGTRHRAAIGLSELSDAVVIVVSEETGIVSIARGGKLERVMDLDKLSEQLRNILIPKKGVK